jgi:hypothetical protein
VQKVWNSGANTGTIQTVDLNFPAGEDLYLDPSTPKTVNPNRVLAPGDTLTTTWLMSVKNRITRRLVTISAIAYDDEGNPVTCTDALPIANLRTSMTCSAATSARVIAYDSSSRRYTPASWSVTGTLTNTGGAPLTGITAEIALADSSLARYVTFDPDPAFDNTNPKTLPALTPSANALFIWRFTLAGPDTTGVSVFPAFTIRYGSAEIPVVASGCTATIEIQPVITVGVEQPGAAAADLELFPDPTNGAFTVLVPALAGVAVRITVVDMLGRERLRLEEVSASERFETALRIAPAAPGTYFLHITAGDRRWVRLVRVY